MGLRLGKYAYTATTTAELVLSTQQNFFACYYILFISLVYLCENASFFPYRVVYGNLPVANGMPAQKMPSPGLAAAVS